MAQTMATELASALVRSQEESARALLEAARRAQRGILPALELQGGSKPSVKATKVWLEKVKVALKDFEELEKLVTSMLKDQENKELSYLLVGIPESVTSRLSSVT